jgi:hypothetical protein
MKRLFYTITLFSTLGLLSWTNTTAQEKKDRETSKEEKALLYSDECISELKVVKA